MELRTVGLVVLKNRKLLQAHSKNKNAFYLTGRKADKGETAIQVFIREISEELNIVPLAADLEYYMQISAPAYNEQNGIIMEQDYYLYELNETPIPNAEICAHEYFDADAYKLQPAQVPEIIILIQQLQQDGLIG